MQKNKSKSNVEYIEGEEILSETFYAKCSLIGIILIFIMLIKETFAKYFETHNELTIPMIKYFNRVGYVLIIYTVFYLGMKAYQKKITGIKLYFKENKHDIMFIIFLIYSFVAALLSSDRDTSFWGHMYRNAGFITYLMYASVYICGKQIGYIRDRITFAGKQNSSYKTGAHTEEELEERERQKRIIKLCVYFLFMFVCAFQNILLIREHLGYSGSMEGAFYNTNHSAYFMVLAIFATIGFISLAKVYILKLFGIEMYLLNLWCLIINDTLGAYLAVIAGLIFLAVLYFIKYKKVGVNIIICIVLFVAVSVAVDYKLGIISANFRMLSSDTESISSGSESAGHAGSGRWELWVKGVEFVKEHPVIGCGPDCVPIDKETGEDLMLPHNEYLQYAMEIGMPAALCYVAGLVLLLIKRLRDLKYTDESVLYDCAAVFGYCASAFFGINMFYTAVYYFIFLGMVSAKTPSHAEK